MEYTISRGQLNVWKKSKLKVNCIKIAPLILALLGERDSLSSYLGLQMGSGWFVTLVFLLGGNSMSLSLWELVVETFNSIQHGREII